MSGRWPSFSGRPASASCAAEAGAFPGITLYLRYWFPAKDRTQVTGLFTAAAPISPVLGSSIAGTLAEMDGLRGWHGWQWMFGRKPSRHWSWASVVLFCLTNLPEPDDPVGPAVHPGAAGHHPVPRPRRRAGHPLGLPFRRFGPRLPF
ncbi:MFS transporter [Paracoccus salipaludis]|uniref:MFS transporter n=1 Tax=Paracoccus salipaludis TaxID=2032623 RepID=UPI003B838C2B